MIRGQRSRSTKNATTASIPDASDAHMASPGRRTNKDVLEHADTPSMSALLSQRRQHWLGHIYSAEDGRIPKDVLYDELASGARHVGCPVLQFRDACKRDIKSAQISIES